MNQAFLLVAIPTQDSVEFDQLLTRLNFTPELVEYGAGHGLAVQDPLKFATVSSSVASVEIKNQLVENVQGYFILFIFKAFNVGILLDLF